MRGSVLIVPFPQDRCADTAAHLSPGRQGQGERVEKLPRDLSPEGIVLLHFRYDCTRGIERRLEVCARLAV